MLSKNLQILSDLVTWDKYAKYLPDNHRRENWNEIVDRDMNMHIDMYPQLTDDIV